MVLRYKHQGKMVRLMNPGTQRPSPPLTRTPTPTLFRKYDLSFPSNKSVHAFRWLMYVPLEMCVTINDVVI